MPVATARAPLTPYQRTAYHANPGLRSLAPAKSKLYNPRHPERTVRYRTVAGHLETWLALSSAGRPMARWTITHTGLLLVVHPAAMPLCY